MTNVGYPDLSVTSRQGNFTATAQSSDNAEGGRRFFQGRFCYRLIDAQTSQVVWERPQPEREASPHQLFVSDEGWVVVRTHAWNQDHLLAMTPTGQRVLSIPVKKDELPLLPGFLRRLLPGRATPVQARGISDAHVQSTSAGPRWTTGSCGYFFSHRGPNFCIMTGWGRRIIFDLGGRRFRDQGEGDAGLISTCEAAERKVAIANLARATSILRDDEWGFSAMPVEAGNDRELRFSLDGHIGLCIRHRMQAAVPLLTALASLALHDSSWVCRPLGGEAWVARYAFRPLIALGIRYLGGIPPGVPGYGFCKCSPKTHRAIPDSVLPLPSPGVGRDALVQP